MWLYSKTGGHVSLLQEAPSSIERFESNQTARPSEKETMVERQVPWETILKISLASSPEEIAIQRSWGAFSSSLRDIAPETEWLFLREENSHPNEAVLVARLQRWLESIVTSVSWPSPPRVIITAEGNAQERSWKIVFDKASGSFPYTQPPASLNVTPYKDQHLVGWKVRPIYSFTVNKAGEA